MNTQSIKDFQGTEATPCNITMVDTCHKFVQTQRMYNTKNNTDVSMSVHQL